MGKGFTQMIGLAVVVALAIAAVFGAMSLANPAFAAIGQPADTGLTERTVSPQEAPAPGGIDATGGINQVTVAWSFVAAANGPTNWEIQWAREDGNFAEDDWRLASEDGNVAFTEGTAAIPTSTPPTPEVKPMFVVQGLNNNITYKFSVRRAPTDGVPGKPSATVRATPAAPPDPGDNLVVTAGVRSATLAWDRDDDGDATGWQLRYANASEIDPDDSNMDTMEGVLNAKEWQDVRPTFSNNNSDATLRVPTSGRLDSGVEYKFQIRALAHDTPSDAGDTDGQSNTNDADFLTEPDDIGESDMATPLPAAARNFTAMSGDGEATISWGWARPTDPDPGVTEWVYQYKKSSDEDVEYMRDSIGRPDAPADPVDAANLTMAEMAAAAEYAEAMGEFEGDQSVLITELDNNASYTFQVWAVATETLSAVEEAMATAMEPPPFSPTFTADSTDPGSNTRYDLKVRVDGGTMNTLTDELVIKLEDFGMPSSIGVNSIAINVSENSRTTIPEDVAVSGEKIFITIGDLNKDRTGGDQTAGGEFADFDIGNGGEIHVVLRQSAGISNPTASGDYGPVVTVKQIISNETLIDEDFDGVDGLTIAVPRILGIDPEDGGLGEEITVTGEGFRKGTSLLVFVDKPVHMDDDNDASTPMSDDDGVAGEDTKMPNRILDPAEDVVCTVAKIDGDSVGVCTFTISHPSFAPDVNFLNAVDGRDMYVSATEDLPEFLLEQSISASPNSGNPGQVMLVQLVDFSPNTAITKVELSRTAECSASCGVTNSSGSGTYNLVIPNWAKGGVQELRVTVGTGDNAKKSSTNVTIGGPRLTSTPETVVANQRISLVGTGFSPNSKIGDDEGDSIMSIGGDPIPWGKINDNDDVVVDSGGNWSASVDLPLTETTTGTGTLSIRVRDSGNRSGIVKVSVQKRSFEIVPESGRVGTLAVIRGEGYPGKNDEGKSFSVVIEYQVNDESKTTVSVIPDAGGDFEAQIRIPTSAAIPSTNPVQVSFEREGAGPVVETEQHMVPEGEVVLTPTSGGPGSMVSLHGEGFKSFVPVKSVKIGSIEVTPSPRPSTDINGMMDFDVLIPGLDVGIQTIEVQVGSTTASRGFTITESGINPGNIVEIGAGLEDLGDNFVNIWHFNNDTKAWSFYDGMEGSDLTHLITGETYLIQIKSTMEVILNHDTRNLTCVGANCWNQVVW